MRVRSVSRGKVWASAGVQGAWVGGCGGGGGGCGMSAAAASRGGGGGAMSDEAGHPPWFTD